MNARIALLPGDGIGPEVVAEAKKVLHAIAERFGHTFEFAERPIGGQARRPHQEGSPSWVLRRFWLTSYPRNLSLP